MKARLGVMSYFLQGPSAVIRTRQSCGFLSTKLTRYTSDVSAEWRICWDLI